MIAALALIGGLAAACFATAFGIVFLGEPRSPAAARARARSRPSMLAPMLVLAGACLGRRPGGPARGRRAVRPPLALLPGGAARGRLAGDVAAPLRRVAVGSAVLLALVAVVALAAPARSARAGRARAP